MHALPPAAILVFAIMLGSAMDATIKWLTLTNAVLIVVLGRYVTGALFSGLIYWRAGAPVITAEMWRGHAWRGLFIAASASGFFYALSVLPFAEAVALSFIYPLIIPFVAAALLRERVRASSFGAALIGFVGVIVAAQGAPSAEEAPDYALGVAAVLASAATFAIAMTLLRERAQKDGPAIVTLMSSVIPALIVAAPAIALSAPPNMTDWPIFLLLGVLAAGFMYTLARAYAGAEAQQLAPIHYSELIWASVLGYAIFHETPRVEIYFGAALIICACLYAAYDERRLARRAAGDA
ncbi:MAG TPA: DMT family transporter [Terricaulis sp.]|nr:DMT family transporter [Terricaulis sp.]HRP12432.1 DMT family transporter [Terricaulis sp.]